MRRTADRSIEALNLVRHPTCGYVAESYRSSHAVPAEALPAGFGGARPLSSVLYFMVMPDANIVLHRMRCDQMYHHYAGDALDVLLLSIRTGRARSARRRLPIAGGCSTFVRPVGM